MNENRSVELLLRTSKQHGGSLFGCLDCEIWRVVDFFDAVCLVCAPCYEKFAIFDEMKVEGKRMNEKGGGSHQDFSANPQ